FGAVGAKATASPKAPPTTANSRARVSTGLCRPRLHWSFWTASRGMTLTPALVESLRKLSLAPARVPTSRFGLTEGAVTRTREPTYLTTGSWAHAKGPDRSERTATLVARTLRMGTSSWAYDAPMVHPPRGSPGP